MALQLRQGIQQLLGVQSQLPATSLPTDDFGKEFNQRLPGHQFREAIDEAATAPDCSVERRKSSGCLASARRARSLLPKAR